MSRAVLLLAAVALAGGASAAPRPHVDADAIREVRRGASDRYVSGRAISHYLAARRAARDGDTVRAAEELRLAVAYDESSAELRVSLAEALAVGGRLEQAEGEARRAVELARAGPAASDAHVLLARIATARRQTEQAIAELRQAIRLESALADAGERPEGQPWRLLAATYLELGDDAAAARALEDLATRRPGEGDGFREAGRAFVERRDFGRAERFLRRALELAPGDAEAWRLLAQVHDALGRASEARDDLVALLRLDPDDAPALLALGRGALRADEPDRAREWFHRYLRASRQRAEAAVRIVYQWLEAGRGADALQAARASQEEVGPDPRLRFAEGLALQDLRRWTEAAAAFATVGPELDGFYLPARAALADVLSRAGRHAEAERALAEPLRAHPADVRLLTTQASVLERAGRAREAAALLDRAAAERERAGDLEAAAELSVSLGETLVRSGRAPDAVAALRRAVAAHPRDGGLLLALGAAYARAGEVDAAAGQLRALLALEPERPDALALLGRTLAERAARLDEAERLARRAAELRPRSAPAHDALGWVLLRRGDAGGAVAALERAEALAGRDARILDHLGDAYRAAARPGDAAAAWRRALAAVADEVPAEQVGLRAELERKLRELVAAGRGTTPVGAARVP